MVRSEDEIRRYDIFKGSVLGVLLLCTALAYRAEAQNRELKKLRMGLSMVTPPAEDHVINTEIVKFSGSAPGAMVFLISNRKKIGESKVAANYGWSMDIPARELIGTEVTLVAKDDKDQKLEERGPYLFPIDEELQKKIQLSKEVVQPLPVEVTAPIDGQAVSMGVTGIFGTGVPNTKVKIYLNKEQIGNVTVDASGEWQLSRKLTVLGPHKLSAVTTTHTSTVVFDVTKDN